MATNLDEGTGTANLSPASAADRAALLPGPADSPPSDPATPQAKPRVRAGDRIFALITKGSGAIVLIM
ncbi:MAG: hypothetical protein ABI137_15725, partial [Antricoccus sp.]